MEFILIRVSSCLPLSVRGVRQIDVSYGDAFGTITLGRDSSCVSRMQMGNLGGKCWQPFQIL